MSKSLSALVLLFTISLHSNETLPKNLFVELGKKVNPAVVNISTAQVVRMGGFPGMDPFFAPFFDPWGMGGQGDAPQRRTSSLGSGFIIDSSGLIITNNHVVKNASEIDVQLTEKSKPYRAKLIGQDAKIDIALIKIEVNQKLPTVALGNSDKVEVGEWVAAFGNPFGHGHSMTKGIISAKERDLETPDAPYFPYLQTDASINPGNSGGPLVNTEGEVIGVNTAIDARAQGIGFAIPINIVKKVLPELRSKGRVTRGYLGVGVDNLDDRMAKQLGLATSDGAFIASIFPSSPAERAGLKPYDVVTEANGKPVRNAKELTKEIAETQVGGDVRLKVFRDGKSLFVTAKVSQRPDEIPQISQRGRNPEPKGSQAPHNLGLGLSDITPPVARELQLPPELRSGAVVVEVKEGSLADQAGFEPGDVIIDVNKVPVRNAKEAIKAFKKSKNLIRAYRSGRIFFVFM